MPIQRDLFGKQRIPDVATASGIRDNHSRGIVGDFLNGNINDGTRLSVMSAFFTIYAYDALKKRLDRIEHMDFLFGEPRFIRSLDPDKTEKKAFIIDASGLKLANTLEQKRVARECSAWIRDKVSIRSVIKSGLTLGTFVLRVHCDERQSHPRRSRQP
ncbi:MAG: hypothetical protein A2X56_06155 [Nitrospirae bacterium GWC2_57_13]|jgi:hypothetical protein|nr:MAG: hypothetical protein A2X56_06155 [Nitrospirae bacterium GWC2_57_13]OGW44291.1 MAG: hypothetical protein A2X57_01995 [Nitrospirae bacterium GWD2_57_8]HAR46750.1 hypothetical protein [Nitrospiraceae bacterium]HAS54288.1 hypothetical protein [Nitrospiraceae bacterium]